MAKQNVTFAERHLEKFVVGAAGLIALGTIALYGVTSPNKVTVEGEDLGPKALFAKLKMTAESAQQSIQRKKPDELPRLPDAIGTKGGPHKVANLPLDYVVGAYAPNPKVPSVIGSDVGGTLVLAPVLPPKAVTVCYGHASAALPPMQVIQVGSTAQQSQQNTGLTPVPNDYAWALVTAVVDRKAQKAEYEKAKYDERYSQLVLASMQTERRELGPDGRWSEPKLIRGYAEQVLTGDASVKPTQSEGATTFTEAQHIYINEYRSKLYTPEAQAGVLRPPFQQLLDKQVLAWQPPKTLPGYEFKWTDWGVSVPVEGESQPGLQPQYQPPIQRPGGFQPMQPGQGPRIRGPQPPPAGPAGPPSGVEEIKAQKKARELIKKAKEAIDKKTDEGYLEADRILQEVIANSTTPTKERDEAESLRKFIEREVAKALNHALQKEDQEKKLGIVTLGKDVEPAWLTDVSVEPGKTYQYRLRFVAFNEYAGQLKRLKNAEDAQRVLIDGQWSDWSEPITIYPAVQVFFDDMRDEGGKKKARIIVAKWARGVWNEDRNDVAVGEPVSFTKGRIDYNYDGIVSGLDNGREYRPRNSRGGFDPPVKTDVLTLVSSSGQVEEHLQEADKLKLRAHRDLVKKEKDLLAKAIEGPTGGMTPGVDFRQQQMRMTPFPGPGGMPPGMMRGRGFRGAPGGMYGPMGRPTDGRDYRDRR